MMQQTRNTGHKKENMWLNLGLNIVVPTIILVKFSGETHLGPQWGIVIALSFPIGYGLYDFFATRKLNFFSILGVISVMLTGGISLLQLDPGYMAIKEAAIPALIGVATLVSIKTRFPLVKTLLYNEKIMDTQRVARALERYNNERAFERTLRRASCLVAASFFLSAVLNYVLAKMLLVSAPGTEAYNAELGKMTAISFPVIFVPSMVVLMGTLYYLFRSITRLTRLSFDEVFVEPDNTKNTEKN